jgi:hypothetical protein
MMHTITALEYTKGTNGSLLIPPLSMEGVAGGTYGSPAL